MARGSATSFEHNVVNEVICSYAGSQQTGTGCPSGSKAYTYDHNGNLTSVTGGTSYGYDKRNRTTSITPSGTGASILFDYADYSQSERIARGDTRFTDTLLGTQVEQSQSDRVLARM